MVTLDIWLFGKPEWEIDLEKASAFDIKELGESLRVRLGRISEIIEKLESNEWSRGAGLYNLHFYKGIKKEDVSQELEMLGIGEKEVRIEDFGEDEEIGEDELTTEDNGE